MGSRTYWGCTALRRTERCTEMQNLPQWQRKRNHHMRQYCNATAGSRCYHSLPCGAWRGPTESFLCAHCTVSYRLVIIRVLQAAKLISSWSRLQVCNHRVAGHGSASIMLHVTRSYACCGKQFLRAVDAAHDGQRNDRRAQGLGGKHKYSSHCRLRGLRQKLFECRSCNGLTTTESAREPRASM